MDNMKISIAAAENANVYFVYLAKSEVMTSKSQAIAIAAGKSVTIQRIKEG